MRLIDADELIKILEEYANDKDSQAIYGEERLRLILGDCKIEIEKFPTAYDVDKVVQKIEDRIKLLQLARIPKSAKIAANNAFLMAIEDIKSVASDERVIKNEI